MVSAVVVAGVVPSTAAVSLSFALVMVGVMAPYMVARVPSATETPGGQWIRVPDRTLAVGQIHRGSRHYDGGQYDCEYETRKCPASTGYLCIHSVIPSFRLL